jgi:hypothetical protein
VSNFWGALHLSFNKTGKDCEISLNTHFLLDFGDFDKSFSLDNAHASLALRSLNHVFIVHEALVLALTFIILEKLLNRLCLEKTLLYQLLSILLSFLKRAISSLESVLYQTISVFVSLWMSHSI